MAIIAQRKCSLIVCSNIPCFAIYFLQLIPKSYLSFGMILASSSLIGCWPSAASGLGSLRRWTRNPSLFVCFLARCRDNWFWIFAGSLNLDTVFGAACWRQEYLAAVFAVSGLRTVLQLEHRTHQTDPKWASKVASAPVKKPQVFVIGRAWAVCR